MLKVNLSKNISLEKISKRVLFYDIIIYDWLKMNSGCGSVGRAVASNARGPRFISSHQQNLYSIFAISCIEKTKIKKKRPGMVDFLQK